MFESRQKITKAETQASATVQNVMQRLIKNQSLIDFS